MAQKPSTHLSTDSCGGRKSSGKMPVSCARSTTSCSDTPASCMSCDSVLPTSLRYKLRTRVDTWLWFDPAVAKAIIRTAFTPGFFRTSLKRSRILTSAEVRVGIGLVVASISGSPSLHSSGTCGCTLFCHKVSNKHAVLVCSLLTLSSDLSRF